jgi:hypothetical protein
MPAQAGVKRRRRGRNHMSHLLLDLAVEANLAKQS